MGIMQSIGIKKPEPDGAPARTPGSAASAGTRAGAAPLGPRSKGKAKGKPKASGKKSRTPREKVAAAAAPLQDRKRRLLTARDATLRDLGGLMLEMYKRNRFREELLLDKCEEILAIEVEIAHIDQRLFQLSPPTAAGIRPIGRCECSSPILPGQNFCGVCGRAFTTLTQPRVCTRCGTGLRSGDAFCSSCGTQAPDMLETLQSSAQPPAARLDSPPSATAAAAAQTVVLEAPPIDLEPVTPPAGPAPVTTPQPTAPAPAAEADADLAIAAAVEAAPLESLFSPPALAVVPSPDAPELGQASSAAVTPAAEPATVAPPQADGSAPADAGQATQKDGKTPPPDSKEGRKLAKERAKRAAQVKKARMKAARERAKQRAKEARKARKHGDPEA